MECPLISIIVPVYNTEKYLNKCMDSIINQSYDNLDIIIVDDGSNDKSGKIADMISEADSRVRVIHKANGGLSSARNMGILQAKGEYIGFVDSDDWIEKNMYQKLYDAIREYQCPVAVCGRYDIYEKKGIKKQGLCPSSPRMLSGEEAVGKILIWDQMDSSACDKLFSIGIFREYRFPDGKLSEDVAIMYKILLESSGVALVPCCLYNYNHRGGSITTSAVFKTEKLHVVDHSKVILDHISNLYPGIKENAIYFRCFILMYAYNLIVNSEKYKESTYLKLIYEYTKELKENWDIYVKYDKGQRNIIHKIKSQIMLNPKLYLSLINVLSKIKLLR